MRVVWSGHRDVSSTKQPARPANRYPVKRAAREPHRAHDIDLRRSRDALWPGICSGADIERPDDRDRRNARERDAYTYRRTMRVDYADRRRCSDSWRRYVCPGRNGRRISRARRGRADYIGISSGDNGRGIDGRCCRNACDRNTYGT